MDWSEKIDNRKYLIGTLIAAVFALYAGRAAVLDVIFLMGVIAASVLNQWLMFRVMGKLLKGIKGFPTKSDHYRRLVLWGQITLKFSVLGVMFYILIVYARHIAAQGLILYTFQLIILILSIKNISAFLKKGSSE